LGSFQRVLKTQLLLLNNTVKFEPPL